MTDTRSLQLAVKRIMDLVLSSLVLVVGLPLFLAIGILVKLSSPGPVFFVQGRVGRGGRTFPMYKFRSMTIAPPGYQPGRWGKEEKARVTRLGRVLRDYGLDELPQVLNILRGDMSIVGPRPPLPSRADEYTERQKKVFQMRPGVLALAAIEGRRSIPMEKRIELHVQYVERWSLWLDLHIMLRCIPVVLGRQGASEVA
jgi:undecaprenyl phosphate N,N'-diacetylbacillosamine 1-phosphate transferase